MRRWTQYDSDEYRLPEGMTRVGYDADTQTYYFKDADGSLWASSEGAEYGELHKVEDAPIAVDGVADGDADLEAAPTRADGYGPLATHPDGATSPQTTVSAYRMLFPFFLLICVFLLLVFRLVHNSTGVAAPRPPEAAFCPAQTHAFRVRAGDTCWGLAQARNCSVERLQLVNPGLECERLVPGQVVCLPEANEAK